MKIKGFLLQEVSSIEEISLKRLFVTKRNSNNLFPVNKKTMKIGFDAKRYYHNLTGLGNYSRTLVGGLKALFPENEYVLYDEKSFSRTFRLGKKAESDGCNLFHGLSNELPFDIKGRKLKSIVTMHDIAWLTFPNMYHWADRHIYNLKYGSSCKRADKVIAISESTKVDVMRFYGVPEERIEVIYQPVQDYYYTPLSEEECNRLLREHFGEEGLPPFILYVGSINSRKNLLGVLRAMSFIPKSERPLLLVVGNGREYRRDCEAFIEKEGLRKDVLIETSIHNNRLLQALYAKALLFIYPSFYEGFGLPVVEAALQKTPVITSTVSSLPEAAGPDACLIDPHAPDAAEQMAMHIQKLCSDRAYALSIGEKMECYSREMFTPEKLASDIFASYKRLIHSV